MGNGSLPCYHRQAVLGLLVAYFACLAILAFACVVRLGLALGSIFFRDRAPPPGRERIPVLVQLPIFNERYVAERLLRAVAAQDHLGTVIQVLDDSTDDTRQVVDRVAESLRKRGTDIRVVRRGDRRGYKAGALARGLELAPGFEFVAIFDADFVPPPEFVRRALAALRESPDVGLVQARWGHLNRDRSLLTRAQAVFLDGHFQVEHAGRAALGHFFNFNGTAGIWRRRAIEDAGGWSSDTITEDLDLSIRAQLRGWRFRYLGDLVADAELPASTDAFLSQQARWVRGSVETARKHLRTLLLPRSGLGLGVRLGATFHLIQNFAYVLMALVAVLLPAAVVLRDFTGWRIVGGEALWSSLDLTFLLSGTLAVFLFYGVGLVGAGAGRRWPDIFAALALGAGMSVANAREVWSGLWSRRSEFVRTPKQGEAGLHALQRYRRPIPWSRFVPELTLAGLHGAACVYASVWGLWGAIPFLAIHLVGFGWLGGATAMAALRDGWGARPGWAARQSGTEGGPSPSGGGAK